MPEREWVYDPSRQRLPRSLADTIAFGTPIDGTRARKMDCLRIAEENIEQAGAILHQADAAFASAFVRGRNDYAYRHDRIRAEDLRRLHRAVVRLLEALRTPILTQEHRALPK